MSGIPPQLIQKHFSRISKIASALGQSGTFNQGVASKFRFTKNINQLTKALNANINQIGQALVQALQKKVSANIGKQNIQGGQPNKSQLLSARAPIDDSARRMLLDFYQEAWRRKYDDYIKRHSSVSPDAEYDKRRWAKQKKAWKRKVAPWYRPNKKIEYVSQGLATGFLRKSIRGAFKKGGGKYLTVHQSLQQIGWVWHPERYDYKYTQWFTSVSEWMYKAGVVDPTEPFVDFLDEDWNKLADIMEVIYRDGPIEELENILSTMRWNAEKI
jgi:hypothetical protein